MALDNAQFISELSIVDPPGTDPLSEGDDQIRTAKRAVFQSFPFIDKQVDLTADQLNAAAITNEANTFTDVNTFGAQIFAFNGSTAAPSYSFTSGNDMGMYFAGVNLLGFSVNAVTQMTLSDQEAAFAQNIRGIAGSTAFPTYSFTGDTDTGMFRDTPNRVSFAAAGELKFLIQSDQVQALAALRAVSGSALAPGYAFATVTDMGLHAISTTVLGFATQGTERARLSSSGFDTSVPLLAQNENTITRPSDTQARTGWRYTDSANQPVWAIYLGTSPGNLLAFQRYVGGAFQDIPLSINNAGGILRMSTLPTSSAGLIAGELWRNPVSPGFVAII